MTPQQAANTIRDARAQLSELRGRHLPVKPSEYNDLLAIATGLLAALKVLEDAANEAGRRAQEAEARVESLSTELFRANGEVAEQAARADTLTHWVKELRAHIMYTLLTQTEADRIKAVIDTLVLEPLLARLDTLTEADG